MAQTIAACANVLVCLVGPLAVLVWFLVKRRSLVVPFLVGALTFLCSQLLTRIPLMRLLAAQAWYGAFSGQYPALFVIVIGLSAGVFEEVGRFIAMAVMKRHRTWPDAVSFGLGHGGLESGLVGLNNLILIFFYPSTLATGSAINIGLAGVERVFAIMAHVGLSVVVMRAVAGKKPLWLLWAILLHGALDAAIGLLPMIGIGVYGIEIFVALFGIGMLVFALMQRKRWPIPALPPIPPQQTEE